MTRRNDCGAEIRPGEVERADVSWDEDIPDTKPVCPACLALHRNLLIQVIVLSPVFVLIAVLSL